MNLTETRPREAPRELGEELMHVAHDCDVDTALCGARVPGDERWNKPGEDCVVCCDLEDLHYCVRCGGAF